MTTEEKLKRIQGRETLYEVAGMASDGTVILVMYSGKSMHRIAMGVHKRGERLMKTLGTDYIILSKEERRIPGCVWLTGRTQREAICEGELPYVKP